MKIKYPNPSVNPDIKLTQNNKVKQNQHFEHRGMVFEHALNKSNEYYRNHDIAYIYKKPTPVQIVKVDYPKRSSAKIVEAYYQTPSTTDYNGIYKGKYIDYEAKETNNKSFPFKNIFPHQLDHLKNVSRHGGIAFVIIFFRTLEKVYLIDINEFMKYYDSKERQSITFEKITEIGAEVKIGYSPEIDYIKTIDEYYKI